ncbi:MAG: protein-L-isoaspartate O-methyltransferase [Helicobacteraceae bacterium 4484_230]|nr:MAG: protein-L-isoaspartate O-methyltransferase [Helicobacteraceae bacterium 4484_230]
MNYIVAMKNRRLADDIDRHFPLSSEVKEAIAGTNREAFVPAGFKHNAYKLDALPIGASQWISSPLTVAKMTEYLQPDGADRVLEIGCGSGYQAAVLSKLFRGVFTIERIDSLMQEAKKRFREEGIVNVHARTDDGQNGWVQYAPFDRIIFSASAKTIPQKLIDQLAPRGVMVAPMEMDGRQVIMRFVKIGEELFEDEMEECEFVPVLDGVQK